MLELQSRIEESRRRAFMQRAIARAEDTHREVPSGQLGEELGLPYEDTLRIVADLDDRGWIRRSPDLAPPAGPMVRLTEHGLAAGRSRAA